MCTQAYRSSGRPEVTYAIERICELAADRLGFDKLEMRRMNLIPPSAMPDTNAVGSINDSGEYEKTMADCPSAVLSLDTVEALRATQSLYDVVNSAMGVVAGPINLGSFRTFTPLIVPELWKSFVARHPEPQHLREVGGCRGSLRRKPIALSAYHSQPIQTSR